MKSHTDSWSHDQGQWRCNPTLGITADDPLVEEAGTTEDIVAELFYMCEAVWEMCFTMHTTHAFRFPRSALCDVSPFWGWANNHKVD